MKSIAIFGGSKLGQRPWRPGKKVLAIAIFGGSEIDFRQAELEDGVTHVVAFSFLGGNKFIVPDDLPTTLSGFSILGGGDIGFPVLLVSSVYFGYGLPDAILVAVFSLLGLICAYWIQTAFLKGRPMPALPPIAVLSLIALLIVR